MTTHSYIQFNKNGKNENLPSSLQGRFVSIPILGKDGPKAIPGEYHWYWQPLSQVHSNFSGENIPSGKTFTIQLNVLKLIAIMNNYNNYRTKWPHIPIYNLTRMVKTRIYPAHFKVVLYPYQY
jgi:hypothetical protein